MTSASVVKTLKEAHPRARVYGLASTGEVVIERSGRKRGHANITVLSQPEALQQAMRLAPSGLAGVSTKVKAKVVRSLIQFFEMQQVVWLYLEEKHECPLGKTGLERAACCSAVETCEECLPVPGPIEDATNSNSDPEEYYPFIGTSLGVSNAPPLKEEVVNPVEVITELKQAVARARIIEFKAEGRTYTRIVRKADAAAFAAIKADIKQSFLGEGKFKGDAAKACRFIFPTLHVRPGFVYVSA